MTNDDDKTLPNPELEQEIATNAEYSNDLDELVDENGNPIDAIEKDQVPQEEDETDSGDVLEKIAAGDEKTSDEDEDKYLS